MSRRRRLSSGGNERGSEGGEGRKRGRGEEGGRGGGSGGGKRNGEVELKRAEREGRGGRVGRPDQQSPTSRGQPMHDAKDHQQISHR